MSDFKLVDKEERQKISEKLDTTFLVEAGAGSGKTKSLVDRMLALLRSGNCRIDTIAAVTFTRKAAAELRGRFQTELEEAVLRERRTRKLKTGYQRPSRAWSSAISAQSIPSVPSSSGSVLLRSPLTLTLRKWRR